MRRYVFFALLLVVLAGPAFAIRTNGSTVIVPVIAVRYGWDWFRTTGSDTRSEREVVVGIGLAFMAWSVALVALGLRTTFRLPWRG